MEQISEVLKIGKTIDIKKFVLLCFVDITLVAIINEKYPKFSLYLFVFLFILALIISIDSEDKNFENTCNLSLNRKPNNNTQILRSTKKTQQIEQYRPKFIPRSNNSSFYLEKEENPNSEAHNDSEVSDENVFDCDKQSFHANNLKKDPEFRTFEQISSSCQRFFKNSKHQISHVNFSKLNVANNVQENITAKKDITKEEKIIIYKEESFQNDPCIDFLKKSINALTNDNKILQIGREMREALLNEKSPKKGLFYIAFYMSASLRKNSGERKSAYFAFALTEVLPKNDPLISYFEKCIIYFCELADRSKMPTKPFNCPRVDDLREFGLRAAIPAQILFSYWCFMDQIDKLFEWMETHSKYEDKTPDYSNGVALNDLIYFGGKKMYDANPSLTSQKAGKVIDFMNKSMAYPGWENEAKYYVNYRKHFEQYKNAVDNNLDEIAKYNLCRSLIKYVDEQI